jgi:hypothetical protein
MASIRLLPAYQVLCECGPPWHELKTHGVVDHHEAPGRQGDALLVDAGDVLALDGWPMNESGLRRQGRRNIQLLSP